VKGVALYGNQQKKIARPEVVEALYKEIRDISKVDPGAKKYHDLGTLQMVPLMNKVGAFPTKYWHSGTYKQWQNLTMDALAQKARVKAHACPKCPTGCGRASQVLEGRHQGLKEEIDYETIGSFGGICLIDDVTEVLYLNDICDRLGMDTISAGNLYGFAIEACHLKNIGERIEYGDVDAIAQLLHKMVGREGIGAFLAEGMKHTSKGMGFGGTGYSRQRNGACFL